MTTQVFLIESKYVDKATKQFAGCTVTARIENGPFGNRLCVGCNCPDMVKSIQVLDKAPCQHIMRALGGDLHLPRDKKNKEQRDALIRLWEIVSTTALYKDICNIFDKRMPYRRISRKINELMIEKKELKEFLETSENTSNEYVRLDDIERDLIKLREEGSGYYKDIVTAMMSLANKLDKGVEIYTHSTVENVMCLLDSLERAHENDLDSTLFLPLFHQAACDRSGWHFYPRRCFTNVLGLNESERTQFKRSYMAWSQGNKFALSAGDVFYNSPDVCSPDVAWGQQKADKVVQITETATDSILFEVRNLMSAKSEKKQLSTFNFIRFLIRGA